jgi:hypothetical protein
MLRCGHRRFRSERSEAEFVVAYRSCLPRLHQKSMRWPGEKVRFAEISLIQKMLYQRATFGKRLAHFHDSGCFLGSGMTDNQPEFMHGKLCSGTGKLRIVLYGEPAVIVARFRFVLQLGNQFRYIETA